MKLVSQLDQNGYFIGVTLADDSPLEPGVFLIPAGAIDVEAPAIPQGKRAIWNGGWVFEDVPPTTIEPENEPLTPEQQSEMIRLQKQYEYQTESDPLFFKWQAGEGTKEEWEAKRAEIKAR